MIYKIIIKAMRLHHPIRRWWYNYWNKFRLHANGVRLGRNACLLDNFYLKIGKNANVKIGDNFIIHSGNNANPLCSNSLCSINVNDDAILSIGDWSGLSGGCIWATEKITIGNHVNIGANCIIMDGDIHNTNWELRHIDRISRTPIPFKHKPIVIEDDVWLGANSIVLKGVTIGARSIIGAGSVVTKDIPADCIAAGNPCRIIKMNGGGIVPDQSSCGKG